MAAKSKVVAVNAHFIREAARDGKVTLTDKGLASVIGGPQGRGRGRISAVTVAAFEAENPGFVYAGEKSALEVKTVTVPLTKPNAKGARLKRPEDFPLAEVRKRAGVAGRKGRLSQAALTTAAESIMKERGWL